MASQTITGPELQYTQDNKRCFAYSGIVSVDTSETTLLTTRTPSNTISCEWHPFYKTSSANNFAFYVYLDDILVQYIEITSSESDTPYTPLKLIIPPFTKVEFKSKNLASGSHDMLISLTGRVYEYLPVRN